MEQGLNKKTININNGLIVENENNVRENINYYLSRNANTGNIMVRQVQEEITNLNDVRNNERYHITRNEGEVLAVSDNSLQLAFPNFNGNAFFGIRKRDNRYFLSRTPALTDYVFETDNLIHFASFKVFGVNLSRLVHVVNTSGKIIKIGLAHINLNTQEGLIDREYRFTIIINNINAQSLTPINESNSVGSSFSRVANIENQNLFVNAGDILGIRYQRDANSNTGQYCQVRLTVDTNARPDNFLTNNIP